MFTTIAWHNGAEEQLLLLARQHAPRELLAVLAGEVRGKEIRATTAVVQCVLPLPNDANDDDSFAVDAMTFARCEQQLRRDGHTLLGFAHSHPGGRVALSQRDREQLWTSCVQVVTDGVTCQAFLLNEQRVVTMLPIASEATA
jgi:proteasome lid subunit RPN8/RPN11